MSSNLTAVVFILYIPRISLLPSSLQFAIVVEVLQDSDALETSHLTRSTVFSISCLWLRFVVEVVLDVMPKMAIYIARCK